MQHLILIEGLGPAEENALEIQKRYRKHVQQRENPKTHNAFASVEEAAQRLCAHHRGLDIKRATYLAKRQLIQKNQHWMWSFDPRHKEKSAIAFSLDRHMKILQGISCPCSLIFGNQSPYTKWIDIAKRSKVIPTLEQTYYIDGGHSPHLTHPSALSQVLLSVLS